MTWLRTDDRYPEHRKVRRLTDGAYRLHHTAQCACAKDETDGVITEDDVADMEHGTRLSKYIPALVDANLWHARSHDCPKCDQPPEGAWIIHDFLIYNPSHGKQEARRKHDRDRQQRSRSRRDTAVTDGDVTRESQGPSRPVPSRPEKTSGERHASNVTKSSREDGDA